MKNLKIFASMAEFETAKPSMDIPFVVLEKSTPKVIYSNLVEIFENELSEGLVDLGLSVKWASCNLGADKPCDYGLLYQWGRVDGYAYDDTNNQFFLEDIDPNHPHPSNITTTSGKIYNDSDILDPADDAAYVATNGKLRMPTIAEIYELLNNTTQIWCQCNVLGEHTSEEDKNHTVYGVLFTSKTNDNKIFIPAAGRFYAGDNGKFYDRVLAGFIWSATAVLTDYNDIDAKMLVLDESIYGPTGVTNGERTRGCSVRGVCE